MGNHCIDCEFCGQDRRVVGSNCCPERTKHDKEQADKQGAKEKANREVLAFHGLKPAWDGKLYADDVVAWLKKHEGKVLKRPPAAPKQRFEVGDQVVLKTNPQIAGEVVKAGKRQLWFHCGNARVGCTHAMVRSPE